MDLNTLLSIFVASGVFLLFLGLDLIISRREIALKDRLDIYAPKQPLRATPKPVIHSSDRRSVRFVSENLQKSIADELSRAGVPLNVSEYIIIKAQFRLQGGAISHRECAKIIRIPML